MIDNSQFVNRYPKLERLGRLFGVGFVACVGCAMTLDKKDTDNQVKCDNTDCTGQYATVATVVASESGRISKVFEMCESVGCVCFVAVYCKGCFAEMNNMCTACMKPIDYGDMSDVSQEL